MPFNDDHPAFDDDAPRPRRRESPAPQPTSSHSLVYLVLLALGVAIGAMGLWLGGKLATRLQPQPAAFNPDAKSKEAVAHA